MLDRSHPRQAPRGPQGGAGSRIRSRAVSPAVAALAVALASSTAVSSCGGARPPSEARPVRIASGVAEQDSYAIGAAIIGALRAARPDLSIDQVETTGSPASVGMVLARQADFALAQADVVYTTFAQDDKGRAISGVAVLYPSVLHVVADVRAGIRTLDDLRGKRLAVGSARGSRTEALVRAVLGAAGIPFDQVVPVWLPRTEMARALTAGMIDAACHLGGIRMFAFGGRVRLIPITRPTARTIRARLPFLRPMFVPAGTYSDQQEAVASIGMDMLLVCRRDLDERLVTDVVRVVSDALPDLARTHQVLRAVELRNLPTPPIPLHSGAVRFYREQALFR